MGLNESIGTNSKQSSLAVLGNVISEKAENARATREPSQRRSSDIEGDTPASSSTSENLTPERKHPSTVYLVIATFALQATVFLVALDTHILATAMPKITTEFDSLIDITWYGGAYLLAQIAVQPTYGRLYQSFPIKRVFPTAIAIFEIGSIIAASSNDSRMLIAGRAIQGTGAGGVVAGVLLMISVLVPVPKRPLYLSFITIMYAVAAVLGPVLGGIFTETKLTWRFCFWMNLPIGAISCAIIIWIFVEPRRSENERTIGEKLKKLDPLGASIFIACVTCLLMALQRASIPQPWSYSGIWGPLLGFGILLCVFVILQYHQKDKAIIPYRILVQRSVAFSCLFSVTILMASTTIVYYLPFYFQSVKGFSPRESGIHLLPYVVTNSAFNFAAGIIIAKVGIYVPFMFLGAAILAIGGGLLFTLDINSGIGPIVGFQSLASAGFGLCVQVPFTAIQVLPEKDLAIGNGLILLFQGLGSSLAISAAQTIFSNSLHHHLEELPDVNADAIISYGAVNIVGRVPDSLVYPVRLAYGAATSDAFKLTIAGATIASIASLGVEWRRSHSPVVEAVIEELGVTQRQVIEA